MRLLRFDASGARNFDNGISDGQLRAILPVIDHLRHEMLAEDPIRYSEGNLPESQSPLDSRFYWLPAELLDDYKKRRESSELGRVFDLANSIIDYVDAVVVLGIGGSYMGAKALMDALCDPYHNELSRSARGSRPRIYFEGNNLDNDSMQSLISRLASGGYGDSPAEKRHALVVVSKSGTTLETAIAFRIFLNNLKQLLNSDADEWVPKLVIPITGKNGKLRELSSVIGCKETFNVPEGVGGRFSMFSSVGLLPAALLGIDCMKLLQGAMAMNRHFEDSCPEDNIIMQYVAANHLLAQSRGKNIRVLSVWSKQLESTGMWYDQLLAESNGKNGIGTTPITTVNTRDLHSRHQQHQQGRNDKVFNNLVVETQRTDPLQIGMSDLNQDGLNDLAKKSVSDVLDAAIKGTNEALRTDARPTTTITLPAIEPFYLGQLYQMLMIATVIEGRLLGVNPYGQPGVEKYKINMNKNLGRV